MVVKTLIFYCNFVLLEHMNVFPKLWNLPDQHEHLQPEQHAGEGRQVELPSLQGEICLFSPVPGTFVNHQDNGGYCCDISLV